MPRTLGRLVTLVAALAMFTVLAGLSGCQSAPESQNRDAPPTTYPTDSPDGEPRTGQEQDPTQGTNPKTNSGGTQGGT